MSAFKYQVTILIQKVLNKAVKDNDERLEINNVQVGKPHTRHRKAIKVLTGDNAGNDEAIYIRFFTNFSQFSAISGSTLFFSLIWGRLFLRVLFVSSTI